MEYYGTGHPTYANGLSKISRLFLNAGTPFGRSIVEATNSDPSVTVYYNGYQSGLNMPAYGVRIPSSYKPARVPKDGGGFHDSAIVIYNADTGVAYDFYSFAWVPENNRYEASILRPLYSFSSLGHGTAKGDRIGTSASGVAGPFGVLRGWEINTVGQAINHCLQAALPADPGTAMLMAKDALIPIILPATAQDAAAYNSGWAEGVIPYGGLIAIPPVAKGGPNLATLGLSEPGMRLAEAIRDYGIRAVDKGGPAIRIDQSFNESLRDALNSDMTKLQPHMRVCDFAKSTWSPGQTAPFGGGTPLGPNTGIAP